MIVPLVVWIAALVLAVVVLGFCAYELVWKSNRLRRDLASLQALSGDMQDVRTQLVAAQQRIAESRR